MAESDDKIVSISPAVEAALKAREADPALYSALDIDEVAEAAQICSNAIHKISRIADNSEVSSVISVAQTALESVVELAQHRLTKIRNI